MGREVDLSVVEFQEAYLTRNVSRARVDTHHLQKSIYPSGNGAKLIDWEVIGTSARAEYILSQRKTAAYDDTIPEAFDHQKEELMIKLENGNFKVVLPPNETNRQERGWS